MSFLHNKKRVKYLCFELNRNFKKVGGLNGLAISGGTKALFLMARPIREGKNRAIKEKNNFFKNFFLYYVAI